MQVYLVGGAVRDELLGLPVGERDWCVTGAGPSDLLDAGYRQVGKDFPVFLHPESGEEYALARTERKIGPGYRGFVFDTSREVSIEADLARRDLTINAMARDENGKLIDPWGGRADIDRRRLRHVSEAFVEDPVRILRVARFAARLHAQGFSVAPDTLALMRRMTDDGEVDTLVPDRVWKETELALRGANGRVFFAVLRATGALARVYPEIDALFGIPRPGHPELDTGAASMRVLDAAERLSTSGAVRFAALVHDLGKTGTDGGDLLPNHPERHRSRPIRALAQRFPVPRGWRELAILVAEYRARCHRALALEPDALLQVLEHGDAFRRRERFERFLLACEATARGREARKAGDYPPADYLRQALAATLAVNAGEIAARHGKGDIPAAIRRARRRALTAFKTDFAAGARLSR